MVEFFDMGGHGFYIWISYGIFAVMLGYHYFAPLSRHKKLIQTLSLFYANENANEINDEKQSCALNGNDV